jgi:hypothetical protein
VVIAVVVVTGILAGCTPGGALPTGTGTGHSTAGGSGGSGGASASASPKPAATFVPGGTAEQNLPIFTQTVEQVWASAQKAEGRAYVDALVAAGFDKGAMQVTNDKSTVGNPAESIQFSVRVGDQCLVGQVGPAIGDPVSTVLPVLAGGTCLLGNTRPINW